MAQSILKRLAPVLGVVAALLAAAAAPAAATSGTQVLVSFDRAFGNTAPFVGAAGAVRGVGAAGLPWAVREAHATVLTDGQLFVSVRGLVLADDPSVPAALRGVNPVPAFAAIVSCLTPAAGGGITTTNVITGNVAAGPAGDADIFQQLALPSPCVAPVVMVTSPNGGAWFAATGSATGAGQVATQRFTSAFGNTAPFLGAAGAIQGVNAAGLPWAIAGIFGMADDPSVPASLRNTNPVAAFVAVVSCLTSTGGQVATANVASMSFPADAAGNAFTNQSLTLPQPCVAPIVFVGPSAGAYFAVTGA
ncbi:MAG: hypothetical protein E6J41_27070 [Chloroflexi bacterium]|nr:MAG: hypothetical protein E6J41_27070 [Chloroflexota bacterium]